jgi:hypothetical protein
MKHHPLSLGALWVALTFAVSPAIAIDYTFFVRQVQMPDAAEWDVTVAQDGSQQSPLAINPNGARFELWTVKANPLTSYLLDTTYVNSYIPVSSVLIQSEDPYSIIPRTRCDRPFQVTIKVNGLSIDPEAPDAAKSVKLLRHVQSYVGSENGATVKRGQATLLSQGSLKNNGDHVLAYTLNSVPGGDRTKVKGEERFSVYSLADYQAPESQLASKFIQIWPLTDLTVTGITPESTIKDVAPNVNIHLKDLYPDSYTYVQVYPGNAQLGTAGTKVPGAAVVVDSSVPRSEIIRLKDWDASIATDGVWTMEVITVTPFGTDRLSHVSFTVDRAIKVNGAVTSAD